MNGLRAFFLVGPTATGKSAVAQRLAERLGMAVLSADSMAVYRGMDIGTAKPTPAERARVPYGGIDLVEPDREFNAWDYRRHALAFLEACRAAGRAVIVAGGSGLHVRALTEGLDACAGAAAGDRPRWEALCRDQGVEALQDELRRAAPERLAALADPRNPRRLIRALELAAAGVAPAPEPGKRRAAHATATLVGLSLAPERLAVRVAARVTAMFAGGLVEEARGLRERFPQWSRTASQAIGYAEALELAEGRCTRAEAEARCAAHTRRLAKRQRTWFRHQARVAWVELDGGEPIEDIADRVQGEWGHHGPVDIAGDE